MESDFFAFKMFFHLLGILLTFMAITIVGQAAMVVVGKVRKGMLSLLWGLLFIAISFIWAVARVYDAELPDLQTPLIVLGMVLILFFSKRLFSLYNS